ncbi:hypothetical protein OG497_37470 [Streptomyces sp. NBC_01242]|uniref:hypothetical protein n=1 Tax=Streptomyces sp. NBC_01242 TaxID=2903795 RepID=UPI002253ACF9|nr:hypothetical protein [Streptomyces sp. NBC_01242]MCX4799549.1 hypothetical protein [Streptomyces sp. NBC_01242]
MADARKGLNCTLTYPVSKTNRQFRVRVDSVGHGVTMVADESSARNSRAYYPHRVAPSRFYLRVLLKGYAERKAFSDWMQGYADHVMNPGLAVGKKFPDMRVLVPSRNFDREGVPLTGFEWGDTIGAIVWTPTITFETTGEPQDTGSWKPSEFVSAKDPDLKYFWPAGTQLGGNSVPSGSYSTIVNGSDGGSDQGQGPLPPIQYTEDLPGPWARDDYGN